MIFYVMMIYVMIWYAMMFYVTMLYNMMFYVLYLWHHESMFTDNKSHGMNKVKFSSKEHLRFKFLSMINYDKYVILIHCMLLRISFHEVS